ncbi:protease modulator HflC [Dichelobacter nodosus]|uniref:Protein HflC n=1 Tax=Dichelobacter nodosus (strain VCS1703A) TaxID=246195 RepID=A5EVD9_DICNV|nr:protease modulator HflC [Dichelobacter nodosus]ABQ14095.1 HflC protein [Dichelobacter nodosus VCS1703A]AXM45469.1 protease modulator HflC [Dichelobacter nodosus]TGA66663.1 protease modulator HflC [Dichelobacter nodosus]
MLQKLHIAAMALILLFILSLSSVYIVNERELAVITQFSRLVNTQEKAGLKFKMPFIQRVEFFDKRIQRLQVDPELFLTQEKKYLIVDYYVEWRINDIRRFYTSVQGDIQRAARLVDQLVKDDLRGEFVRHTVSDIIAERGKRTPNETSRAPAYLGMDDVAQRLNQNSSRYGVEIVGIRLKRVDFSDDIRDRVFDRMRAERERVSKQLRAQGHERAQIIRAEADRQAREIIAKADAQAEITRGKADAKAAEIYAKAYGQDLDFYRFIRSMRAYEEGFKAGDVLLLDKNNAFLQRFFEHRWLENLEKEPERVAP